MTDATEMIARANLLQVSEFSDLVKKIQQNEKAVINDHAARGMLHSGSLIAALAAIQEEYFSIAVENAWDTLQETHVAMGRDTAPTTRSAMKSWMNAIIDRLAHHASANIQRYVAQYGAHLLNRQMLPVGDMGPISQSLRSRYEAIVDNYVDRAMNNPKAEGGITINAQNIGAVLTGDGAKAHITQNANTISQMRELVKLMRDVLNQEAGIDQQRKVELVEIADDTRAELDKPSPNETKLMTLFTLLTQAVQTLPAAKPAYDAAKGILATVGVNLP